MKTCRIAKKEEVIYQPYTLEELAAVFDGKIAFKEQMEKAAERVLKIGLPTQPKQGN